MSVDILGKLNPEQKPRFYDYGQIQIKDLTSLKQAVKDVLDIQDDLKVMVKDEKKLREETIYLLEYLQCTSEDKAFKKAVSKIIIHAGQSLGIKSISIQKYYEEKSNGKDPNLTVPAINVRGLNLYWVRGAARAQIATRAPRVIYELAKSEMGYTGQDAYEQVASVFSAYISLGFKDMDVFIQGDHYQIAAAKFNKDEFLAKGTNEEVERVKQIILEAFEAGIYNIDLDASTLELSHEEAGNDPEKREEWNALVSASLIAFIRQCEREGKTNGQEISIGSEVGEVGLEHTKTEEVDAYFRLLDKELRKLEKKQGIPQGSIKGPSKMSINIGTAHGGVTDPKTGQLITDVPIRIQTHSEIYNGVKNPFTGKHTITVQHGASTLALDKFNLFSEHHVAEVHLATGYQNLWLETLEEKKHPILSKMDEWLMQEPTLEKERAKYSTAKYSKDGSFNKKEYLYRNYKRIFGPFKKEYFHLDQTILHQFEEKVYHFNKELFTRLSGKS